MTEEIAKFLLPEQRQDVREAAAEIVLQQSDVPEFVASLSESIGVTQALARGLLRCIGTSEKLSSVTMKACINLCLIDAFRDAWVALNGVKRVIENLKEQERLEAPEHQSLNLMLLANLTRTTAGQKQFLEIDSNGKISTLGQLFVQLLLRRFLVIPDPKSDDGFLYVAHVLINICCLPEGRLALLGEEPSTRAATLESFATQLNSCVSRQPLLLQLVAHLAISTDTHQAFAQCESFALHVLALIYPLHGEGVPTPNGDEDDVSMPTSKRWVHPAISKNGTGFLKDGGLRKTAWVIVRSYLQTAEGRRVMRGVGAYEVIRYWHLMETDEEILLGIENHVHLLVFSEEELADQDQQLVKHVQPKTISRV